MSSFIVGVGGTEVKEDLETDKGDEEVGKMEEPSLILEVAVMNCIAIFHIECKEM